MCGICGVAGGNPASELRSVEAMTRALAHRGPDDHGVEPLAGAVLGHRRLAILDPSPAGRQPFGDAEGGLWLTYNGEIYNFVELRSELERAGVPFRTRTDTEVLLALWRREGAACLGRLHGMFAFAVWDEREGRLEAARDAFGQKPFFWTRRGDRFLFASEVKALLAHPDVSAAPEPAALDDYLALRVVPAPLTPFRGIFKLPAGHRLTWRPGSEPRVERWWSPPFAATGHGTPAVRSDEEWVEELRARIERAVRRHRVSDVPVGAFLSGGLDSSAVVAAMARDGGTPFPTFAVGSDDPSFDERPFARQMAEHAGTTHHEVSVSAGLLGTLPEIVRTLDEPSDPIAACFHEAARLAARHVKVVLGGDGGDELFGGFDRYAAFGMADRYARLPRWLREGIVRPVARRIPEAAGYKSVGQKVHWLDQIASERGGRMYARMSSHTRFGPEYRGGLYGPALASELAERDPLAAMVEPFEALAGAHDLDRMIHADLQTRLPEHTLMLADRLSMAHGLEVRSPLLDLELAECALGMPPHLRVQRGRTKVALRRAVEPWLPSSLVRRGKQGFMFPVARWLQPPALDAVAHRVLSGPTVREGWIRPEAFLELAGEHTTGRRDHHVRIWQLASLDAWARIYLDGEAP